MMKYLVLFCLLLTFPMAQATPGKLLIENIEISGYGSNSNTLALTQDADGVIYLANRQGVFSFDGARWQLIANTSGVLPSALATGADGRVYVGGSNDLGYLHKDERNQMRFVSLRPQLIHPEQTLSSIREIWPRPEGVYFRSSNAMYWWRPGQDVVTLAPRLSSFHRSFEVSARLIVQERRKGLFYLDKGRLSALVESAFFDDKTVFGIVPLGRDLLLATWQHGLFVYDGNRFVPFVSDVEPLLDKNNVYRMIALSGDKFALALDGPDSGLYLLDSQGKLLERIDSGYGLSDDVINHLFEDRQGGLWLALSRGLARVELKSPLRYFDESLGISGQLYEMQRHKQDFFLATSKGVSRLTATGKFTPIAGINEPCFALLSTPTGMLAACNASLYVIHSGKAVQLHQSQRHFFNLTAASEHQVWVGTDKGLGELRYRANGWQYRQLFPELLNFPIRQPVWVSATELWSANANQGVYRIRLSEGEAKVQSYGQRQGLPAGKVSPSRVANLLGFNTQTGIYRFDANASPAFYQDTHTLAATQDGNVYWKSQNGMQWLSRVPGPGERFIAHNRPGVGKVVERGGQWHWERQGFSRIPLLPPIEAYPESNGVTWVTTQGRLYRYDPDLSDSAQHQTAPLLAKVTNLWDQLSPFELDKGISRLDYAHNSLRFHFALPSFDASEFNAYQVMLKGYDSGFSRWENESYKDYTQLPEGQYEFIVKARDSHGNISYSRPLLFEICPPWYRSGYSYLAYAIVCVIALWLMVKLRTRKLNARALKLELEVGKRTQTIAAQKQDIEVLLEQKNTWLANLSHEFRTPLTLILGPVNQLLQSAEGKAEQAQYQRIQQNGERLLHMVDQLLGLARQTEIGHRACVKINASNRVALCVQGFELIAREKGIALSCDIQPSLCVNIQPDGIDILAANLVSNALKYTPEGGEVKVCLYRKDQQLVFEVSDTGIGIPQAQQANVFERFARVTSSAHLSQQGTGLGLALVKELVEQHKGCLALNSAEGQGSCFSLHLPLSEDCNGVHEPPLPHVRVPQEPLQTPVQTQYDAQDERPSVLVIEDTPQMLDYLSELLAQDYRVLRACHGEEGLALAVEQLPDLIISDVMMPGIDGYQVCHRLKDAFETSHIPVILLTAKGDLQSRLEGWDQQADEYLAKPFSPQELLQRIANLLAIRQRLKLSFTGQHTHLEPPLLGVSPKDTQFVERFKALIAERHSDETLNLPDTASTLAMSDRLLQKKLRALLDKTFTEYLRSYRLNRARELLSTGKKAMEVSDETGFSSQAYFNRCFKNEFGQTPGQYQRMAMATQ